MNSMLESKSEVSAAGFLKKLNLSQGYVEDCINMFQSYYEKLTPEFKNSMFREGFTEYNHNVLARISYSTRYEKVVFKYTDEQYALEDEIDGYKFLLAEDSDRLLEIGEKMHNCVASYKNKILSKRCTIVYAIKDGVYSVCIELINGRVVQELCARNKRPDIKTRALLLKWHEKHGIKPCMQY